MRDRVFFTPGTIAPLKPNLQTLDLGFCLPEQAPRQGWFVWLDQVGSNLRHLDLQVEGVSPDITDRLCRCLGLMNGLVGASIEFRDEGVDVGGIFTALEDKSGLRELPVIACHRVPWTMHTTDPPFFAALARLNLAAFCNNGASH